MGDSYLPRADLDALGWMRRFSDGIAADPAAYRLTAADADAMTTAVAAFASGYAAATDPATRSAANVLVKDSARAAAEAVCRRYYFPIKVDPTIGTMAMFRVGVRPLNRRRTPIACPQTAPGLSLVGANHGQQTLRYFKPETSTGAAKPFGATQLQLFMALGDTAQRAQPATPPDGARLVGSYTRNPLVVRFNTADDGRRATYWARWVSRRGDVGPWSTPASMTVAA